MRRSLPLLALLLAGCADPNGRHRPDGSGWERIGERVYRMEDRSRGVTCYRSYTGSDGISCVRTSTPTLEAEK